MKYKDTKLFKIKEIEETSGKKIIKAINKKGIGNLKIIVPAETDLDINDTLEVIIKESKNEEDRSE